MVMCAQPVSQRPSRHPDSEGPVSAALVTLWAVTLLEELALASPAEALIGSLWLTPSKSVNVPVIACASGAVKE